MNEEFAEDSVKSLHGGWHFDGVSLLFVPKALTQGESLGGRL